MNQVPFICMLILVSVPPFNNCSLKIYILISSRANPTHYSSFFKNIFNYFYPCACMLSRSVVSDSLRPMGCSPPGSSVHGILQARILEWIAISSFRGSSQPRDQTHIFCIGRCILYH